MNIVILGAGKTARFAASVLSEKQHNVILIDSDPKVLEQVSREMDVATMYAKMPDISALNLALETSPDLLFAATGDDETNLVSCAIAKNLGFPKTVARIKSRNYLHQESIHLGRLFYVDHLINAELISAQDLFKLLAHSTDTAYEHFAHGNILMRTVKIPDLWKQTDVPIKDLKLPEGLIAALIRRNEEIIFPHGEDKIQPGDQTTLIGEAKTINELHHLFQTNEKRIRSTVLVGGTDVAVHLAHLLIEQHIGVTIIEKDEAKSRALADELPRATIINRDGRDLETLDEESVQNADAFVSCTEDEGTDLLIASMASHLGCPKSIALVANPNSIPLFEKAGIIPALSSYVNVTNRLLAIMHEKATISVSSLFNDQAKIVELKVPPSSKLIGKPLAEIHLPKDLLIATIENHGKVMIGKGQSILCPDDTVIAICSNNRLEQLQHLFS